MQPLNKKKIVNDPVHGFITLPTELIFDIIEHRYFQRLRRIRQLGMAALIYPGALHTRFQHALGAMHLMSQAIATLRVKGVDISPEEESAANIAILLHDIGHGPFSHTLEEHIVRGVSHEDLTLVFMDFFNNLFANQLELAIKIFDNTYPKKFLHQLVSSQLDVDRLDYLARDSFFTGVQEGIIGTERIISMLNVADNSLVVDIKGIYSIEKFLISRRIMYWQVYLHKTVVAADSLIVKILERAAWLFARGRKLFLFDDVRLLISQKWTRDDFKQNAALLDAFAALDDDEMMTLVKQWQYADDRVLAMLCRNLLDRHLSAIEVRDEAFDEAVVSTALAECCEKLQLSEDEARYFVFTGKLSKSAYKPTDGPVLILDKNGGVNDFSELSDRLYSSVLRSATTKYFLCKPKFYKPY